MITKIVVNEIVRVKMVIGHLINAIKLLSLYNSIQVLKLRQPYD